MELSSARLNALCKAGSISSMKMTARVAAASINRTRSDRIIDSAQ